MPSIPGGLTWDPQDRLQKTDHQGGGITYYVYDRFGIRARKVRVNQAGTTSKERLYLGPWETYRETTDLLGTPTLDLERETLHVQTEAGDACLLETKTVEHAATIQNPTTHHRYQHHNHLGTAVAEVISYEEYHLYGTSAYRAANSAVVVSAKRYRYTGKECGEESGLYYHEARYYAFGFTTPMPGEAATIVRKTGAYRQASLRPHLEVLPWIVLGSLVAALSILWGCHHHDPPFPPQATYWEMVFVKGGVFDSEEEQRYVKGFFMDKTEVTVEAYRRCVDAGFCSTPTHLWTPAMCNYYIDGRENCPVTCVGIGHALDYCEWMGKRLPSAQEWEWAARGRSQARRYPWGEAPPSCNYAVMSNPNPSIGHGCGKGTSWPVGSKPRGASLDGILDLAGNVWEFVLGENVATFASRGGAYTSFVAAQVGVESGGEERPFVANFPFSGTSHEAGFRCVADVPATPSGASPEPIRIEPQGAPLREAGARF